MMAEEPMFRPWPKIGRDPVWMRITEKLDGTNACVIVTPDRQIFTQSRKRLLAPGTDNFGFDAWARENYAELLELGEGYHYGEWWGYGIQRGYGLEEDDRRFSLFGHWYDGVAVPPCVRRVPELYRGAPHPVSHEDWANFVSAAAPGYANPEGIIVEYNSGRTVLRQKVIIHECRGGKETTRG